MKKTLAFFLSAIMILCLFAGCEKNNRDLKKEVFDSFTYDGTPISVKMSSKVTGSKGEAEADGNGNFMVSYNGSAISATIETGIEGESEKVALYSDKEALYINSQGATYKLGYKDMAEFLPIILSYAAPEYAETFDQIIEKSKDLIDQQKITQVFEKYRNSFKDAVKECTVDEKGADPVYTLVFDAEKLTSLNNRITSEVYMAMKDFVSEIMPENATEEETEEVLKELEPMLSKITYKSCSANVTLHDGKFKSVTVYSETSSVSEETGNEMTVKEEGHFEVLARGEEVKVDDSLTKNCEDLFEQLRMLYGTYLNDKTAA